MSPKRRRRAPQRTCVACRRVQGKRDMVRVVRTPVGVRVDPTSKMAGRGAYLCRCRECWETALTQRRLEVALKTGLSEEERQSLAQYAETLDSAGVAEGQEQLGS
jgi:predicted RNA-binding protein YlxR (DUF448 family)